MFLPLLPTLLFAVGFVNGCPAGYTDIGNGTCQSALLGGAWGVTRNTAYSSCAADNGYMTYIQNAFDNSAVKSKIAGSMLWLGLTCTGSTSTSCLWDNGVAISNSSYTNFAPGHPNANIGPCVLFNATNGLWYSHACMIGGCDYICTIMSGVYVPSCPGLSYYFRGKCYYPMNDLHFSNAAARCNDDCGNIASIHNQGENSFVREVAMLNSSSLLYAYIGLSCTADGCQWSDGTAYNYNAFGHQDYNIGTCVYLSTSYNGGLVSRGQWISTDCLENGVTVCKKDLTCPIPTQTPKECTDVNYSSGVGEIKSPGYPYGAVKNHCTYVITQPAGYRVSLFFPELHLDTGSTIKIYNTMTDSAPFAILTNSSVVNGTTFYSADNTFGIVFDTQGNTNFKNIWTARFDLQAEGANNCGGIYSVPGTIAGPRIAQNCTYTLNLSSDRTCLRFTSYNLQDGDYVAIYDGEISPENNIAYISHNNGSLTPYYYVVLCTSNTNYMNLVTIGNSGQSYEMFTISVAGSPGSLQIPYAFGGTLFGEPPLPLTNSTYLIQRYQGTYQWSYASGNIQKRVQVVFSYLKMPDPNNIVILDGGFNSPVALAYGSPTRMTYQSSQQNLTVCVIYNQLSTLSYKIGFIGDFIAV